MTALMDTILVQRMAVVFAAQAGTVYQNVSLTVSHRMTTLMDTTLVPTMVLAYVDKGGSIIQIATDSARNKMGSMDITNVTQMGTVIVATIGTAFQIVHITVSQGKNLIPLILAMALIRIFVTKTGSTGQLVPNFVIRRMT